MEERSVNEQSCARNLAATPTAKRLNARGCHLAISTVGSTTPFLSGVKCREVRMRDDQQSTTEPLPPESNACPDLGAGVLDDEAQIDQRFAKVYPELKRLAHRKLSGERSGHTLSTTALVNETYLRLVGDGGAASATRQQFFALAARAMRRVLVDYARSRQAARRGGGNRLVSVDLAKLAIDSDDGLDIASDERLEELVALDDAMTRLRALEPRLSDVVELRFFGGFTEAETAEILGITPRTVARDWVKARGCLSALLGR